MGLPPAPSPILSSLGMGRGVAPIAANGAVLVGRFVRAPIDAFPNAAMLERVNFRPQRRDQRIDDQKMLDGNPVEPMIGAGNLFNKEFDLLIVLLIVREVLTLLAN